MQVLGKTTTLVESIKYVPKNNKILALAFNKEIQKELNSRIQTPRAESLTFHSAGLRAIRQKFPIVTVNAQKASDIVKKTFPDANYDLNYNYCQTLSLCKNGLIDAPSKITEVIYDFNIDTCGEEPEIFSKHIVKLLSECKKDTANVDFDDMIWFPFIFNLSIGKYGYVYVDEYQDLNKAQLVMAKNALDKTGRLIIFRG